MEHLSSSPEYILEKDLKILSSEFSPTICKLKMQPQIKTSLTLITLPNFIQF